MNYKMIENLIRQLSNKTINEYLYFRLRKLDDIDRKNITIELKRKWLLEDVHPDSYEFYRSEFILDIKRNVKKKK